MQEGVACDARRLLATAAVPQAREQLGEERPRRSLALRRGDFCNLACHDAGAVNVPIKKYEDLGGCLPHSSRIDPKFRFFFLFLVL